MPGGVDAPLAAETRDRILADDPGGDRRHRASDRLVQRRRSLRLEDEAASFGDFRSAFMGLVDRDGNVDHYDGLLRVMDADGTLLADRIDPRGYEDLIGEAVEPWSYLKSTYWKALGYPDGVYRVGPLARVIVADRMGTPRADAGAGRVPATARARARAARSTTTTRGSSTCSTRSSGSSSCCADPDILSPRVRSSAGSTATRGSASPRRRAAR